MYMSAKVLIATFGLVFILLEKRCYSQRRFDFSKIDFPADTMAGGTRCDFPQPIASICTSKSDFEIWLETTGLMSVEYQTVKYENGIWSGRDINIDGRVIDMRRHLNFNAIFDSLVLCNFLKLPSMNSLKLDGDIDDGLNYYCVIKVGKKIRQFSFRNPGYFLSKNPNSTEVKNYVEIVKIIEHMFPYNWDKSSASNKREK